jgi:hypothetical protein
MQESDIDGLSVIDVWICDVRPGKRHLGLLVFVDVTETSPAGS